MYVVWIHFWSKGLIVQWCCVSPNEETGSNAPLIVRIKLSLEFESISYYRNIVY